MGEQAMQRLESNGDMLQATTALEPLQIKQIVNGRPISREERDYHEQQFRLLIQDRALAAKYLRVDAETRSRFDKHAIGRKMRVGTLEDIAAWEKAHPDLR